MINPYDVVFDVIHVADMDEAYGTSVLMMSNLTVLTMTILMMIRPREGGTFCWLAGQPVGQLAGRGTLTLSEKFFGSNHPGLSRKKS